MRKKFLCMIILCLFLVSQLTIAEDILYGDLNNDGFIDSLDLVVMERYILGMIDDFAAPFYVADLDGDTRITSFDAVLLARYINGEIENFPVDDNLRNISTMELIKDMGIGWNLGNSLEACGEWINGNSISDYETAWGNPLTTQEMIAGIKDIGFNSVRIPVAWSNLMTDDYTIDLELMDRVEEVVNYVLGY
ncbi:dockerin type I repeat-containing protein [Natronospora cellulosivora (SeqCode)]